MSKIKEFNFLENKINEITTIKIPNSAKIKDDNLKFFGKDNNFDSQTEKKNYIVYNGGYGGFGLSNSAKFYHKKKMREKYGKNFLSECPKYIKHGSAFYFDHSDHTSRLDPILIDMILNEDNLNFKVSNGYSTLCLKEISSDALKFNAWNISEYDGLESVNINNYKITALKNLEKQSILINTIYEFLYDDNIDIDKKLERLYGIFTIDLLPKKNEDYDINNFLTKAINNIKYIPGYGQEYFKYKDNFEKNKLKKI
jgi:hypothetical protein